MGQKKKYMQKKPFALDSASLFYLQCICLSTLIFGYVAWCNKKKSVPHKPGTLFSRTLLYLRLLVVFFCEVMPVRQESRCKKKWMKDELEVTEIQQSGERRDAEMDNKHGNSMTNSKHCRREGVCVTLATQRITPQLERTNTVQPLVSQTASRLPTFYLYLCREEIYCSWF